MNAKSLLVRDPSLQQLDYTHCGINGNARHASLSVTCQRCGSASVGILCGNCQTFDDGRGTSLPNKSGWEQLLKTVTTSGCDVFVNGKLERTGTSAIHAGLIMKSLNKQFALHNAECLSHIKR